MIRNWLIITNLDHQPIFVCVQAWGSYIGFTALKMKILIDLSESNSWIYFYIVLNKTWNIYWSEQSFTGVGTENWYSLWGLGLTAFESTNLGSPLVSSCLNLFIGSWQKRTKVYFNNILRNTKFESTKMFWQNSFHVHALVYI